MILDTNNSCSGSCVSYIRNSRPTGLSRCENLGNPDVIIVWMGVNDFIYAGRKLGTFNGISSLPDAIDDTDFCTGYAVMLNKILLIKKVSGPYDGKLDLPGGTIEWGEKPEETLRREIKEEVGIDVIDYELFDANSINIEWQYKDKIELVHHIGIFYKILNYNNELLENINIDEQNDDSKGAKFYDINSLSKNELSNIAILEIEKVGYKLRD